MSGEYSDRAIEQLDILELKAETALWNAIVEAMELIFDHPRKAMEHSRAINASVGVVMMLPVVGFDPYKIFWTSEGPRIEAVFPRP